MKMQSTFCVDQWDLENEHQSYNLTVARPECSSAGPCHIVLKLQDGLEIHFTEAEWTDLTEEVQALVG